MALLIRLLASPRVLVEANIGVRLMGRPQLSNGLFLSLSRQLSSGQITMKQANDQQIKGVQKKRCLRIVAYNKKKDEYIRCGELFTDETNSPTSCKYHEIGYFSPLGPGNWYNCCKSPDFEEVGCLTGPHSDQVDDAYLRGYSNDPKNMKELKQQEENLQRKRIQ